MRHENPLAGLRFGSLIFLLCGLHVLVLVPAALRGDLRCPIFEDFLGWTGVVNIAFLLSVCAGLGGRISPWRLVALVLIGLPLVWLGARTSSDFLKDVPVTAFFLILPISGVFLTLRFFGWQMRRVRYPQRICVRGRSIRRHRAACESPAKVMPSLQFTLRGMMAWISAWAVVLGSLTTLWSVFKDSNLGADPDVVFVVSWFACFVPTALWMACGIQLVPLRIAALTVVVCIGWAKTYWEPLFSLFCLWPFGVFLLLRLAGFRFLRVANRPISSEPSPRLCASARES